MNDETELLRRYVDQRSEAAFAQLVQHHIAVVYSLALRRVGGDVHLAEDVSQKVFADLARKASTLTQRTTLSGWLYAATHHTSAAVVRGERRRKVRDFEAHRMQITLSATEPIADWGRLRPVIDDAIVELGEEDREAVIKRFFEQRSFVEIGKALLVSEEAARKRVDRALDKLHALLVRRGVTSTGAALGLALTGASASEIPFGLTERIARGAVAHATAVGVIATGVSLLKNLFPLAAAVAVGASLIGVEEGSQRSLRAEIAGLRGQEQECVLLRAQNRQLNRDLASYAELSRFQSDQSELPALRAAMARRPATPTVPVGVTITLTTAGTLRWNKEFINLDEFLSRLKSLQAKDPDVNVMIVAAEDAKAVQLSYVVDEVRKAGLLKVTVRTEGDRTSPRSSF